MRINHPNLVPLEEYKNNRTKILIKCNVCGHRFRVTPGSLYMGHGCPKCLGLTKTHDEFVREIQNVNSKINILGIYSGNKKKIKVSCIICKNVWDSTPNALLRGRGCPYCSGRMRKTTDEFIADMKRVHPELEVIGEYINNKTKVKCRCRFCGDVFYGTPHTMLDAGAGCKNCTNSQGERAIRNWLVAHEMKYDLEHTFQNCKDKKALPFDFFLPDNNVAIEYDGRQHYEKNDYFGGEDAFNRLVKHDKIKDEYCKSNNIRLIRIPYWDFNNIDNILSKELVN